MSDALLARLGVGFFATTLVAALVAVAIAPLAPIRTFALLAALGSIAGIALQLLVLGPLARSALDRIAARARELARGARDAIARLRAAWRDRGHGGAIEGAATAH